MIEKNLTRLSSLLGTWTGKTHLQTKKDEEEVMAYFALYLMPDPLRNNQCQLKNCNEMNNQICLNDPLPSTPPSANGKSCVSSVDRIVDWSDVSAFLSVGIQIDTNRPFNVHTNQTTDSWIGPFNIILAQNKSAIGQPYHNNNTNTTNIITDYYIVRYVQSPMTSYLRMHHSNNNNSSFFSTRNQFDQSMGPIAVRETIRAQYNTTTTNNNNNNNNDGTTTFDIDPFQKYHNTCVHGDVKPLLPLFHFIFIRDNTTSTETTEESIQVSMKYQLMTMPSKSDTLYHIYPMIQQKQQDRWNKRDLGFSILGPYCYGNDPKGAYSFDFDYNSNHVYKYLQLQHDCIKGLPCKPPAAKLIESYYPINPYSEKTTTSSTSTTTILENPFVFLITLLFFGIISLCSLIGNWRLLQQRNKLRHQLLLLQDQEEQNITITNENNNENNDPLGLQLSGLEMEQHQQQNSESGRPSCLYRHTQQQHQYHQYQQQQQQQQQQLNENQKNTTMFGRRRRRRRREDNNNNDDDEENDTNTNGSISLLTEPLLDGMEEKSGDDHYPYSKEIHNNNNDDDDSRNILSKEKLKDNDDDEDGYDDSIENNGHPLSMFNSITSE